MAINKNIKVGLHDEELDFLKWLAKRDNITVQEEMRSLFFLQLREEMDLYNEERLQEESETKDLFILETPDGDLWGFDDEEEARRNQYLLGGKITRASQRKAGNNDKEDVITIKR